MFSLQHLINKCRHLFFSALITEGGEVMGKYMLQVFGDLI